MEIREFIQGCFPWWAKGLLKLGLSKTPVSYPLLKRMGLARHGRMAEAACAFNAFQRHYGRVEFTRKMDGFTVLELGPGDSLFSGVIAKAHGADSTCMVDVGPFATRDVNRYRDMARFLRDKGLPAPDVSSAESLEEVMRRCAIRYETTGLAALKDMPDESFDLIYSAGVIQHVFLDEVPELFRQLRRLVRPGGVTIHSFDFRDMMGQSLHHLRFSESFWESELIRNSGFYTNRLRQSQVLQLAQAARFRPILDEVNCWDALPLHRKSLKPPFNGMAEDDLRVKSNRVIFQPH